MSDESHAAQTPQDHGHEHPKHELSHYAKRIYAIRDLLLEKGVITETVSYTHLRAHET